MSNTPTKLAAVWFGNNERVIAITIAVAAQAIGAGVGFVVPAIWVTDDDTDDQFKDHIRSCLIAQAIAAGVSFLLVVIFLKEKPPTPPSSTAE